MSDTDSADREQPPAQPRPRKKPRSRLTTAAGILLTVAIFVWFGKGLAENWDDFTVQIAQVSVWVVIAAAGLYLAFFLFISLCYHSSLRVAGAAVSAADAVNVYLASQLGKYVPGKFVYVAGQIGLAKWLRISVAKSTMGFTAHHIFIAGTSLLIASPLLGLALERRTVSGTIILSVVGIVILASGAWIKPFNVLQRKRGKTELQSYSPLVAVRAVISASAAWVAYGTIAALLTRSMVGAMTWQASVQVGMAAVAAWLLGFLSFIAPAGLGVREGAFVLLTRAIMPEPAAMGVALLMRLIHTTLQVPIGALSLGYSVRRRPADTPTAAD